MAMPQVDGFKVLSVVAGYFPASSLEIRPLSGAFPGHSQKLIDGAAYRLVIRPSDRTRQQLREVDSSNGALVWVAADEVKLAPN